MVVGAPAALIRQTIEGKQGMAQRDGAGDRQLASRIRTWMFDAAAPFWLAHGFDAAHGGAVEELDFDGRDALLAVKRTRVVCRQIYVFSHAAVLGWPSGLDAVARAAEHLVTHIWQGPDKGFARLMTREGVVADGHADLYDTAFAMLAFAWAYRATGDAIYRAWALKTLEFVELRLPHASGIGFLNQISAHGWRQQNPHMHLLEACLAAFEATGEDAFRDRARSLGALFEDRFMWAPTGTLTEFFGDDMTPAPAPDGAIVEPGHLYEWVWILGEVRRLLGDDYAVHQRVLAASAARLGLDPSSGAVRNRIDRSGAVLDAGSRTWPNTERIKAAVALSELDGVDPWPELHAAAGLLLDRYLTARPGCAFPSGAWCDAFDGEGRPTAARIPASTLYHLFLAFAEVLRIDGMKAQQAGASPSVPGRSPD